MTFHIIVQEVAEKTVPLEVRQHVKHDKRGILSMGRMEDPDSGGSSFSILLDSAPHLDMRYSIFGYHKLHPQSLLLLHLQFLCHQQALCAVVQRSYRWF